MRKIEVFPDGSMGYASRSVSQGDTLLGELQVLSLAKIARQPEFEPVEVTQREFEEIWSKATLRR